MRFLKVVFLFLFILNTGCGVKGYPKPPRSLNIAGIKSINIKQMGDYLVIYWNYKKVYQDGSRLDEKVNFYLISKDEESKINPYKKGDLYWIIEPIKDFEAKACYKIKIRTAKSFKEKTSNYACFEPVKNYPLLTSRLKVELKENGIYLNWEKEYPQVNIYRDKNPILIPPIPYKVIKNSSDYFDLDVKLREQYCYFITVSENNIESNASKIICKKFIDEFPPEPPKNANILIENKKILIVWDESPSKDVIGYIIYKNGKPITEIPIKSYYFIDNQFKNGDIYEIIAIDKAGNRSKPLTVKLSL